MERAKDWRQLYDHTIARLDIIQNLHDSGAIYHEDSPNLAIRAQLEPYIVMLLQVGHLIREAGDIIPQNVLTSVAKAVGNAAEIIERIEHAKLDRLGEPQTVIGFVKELATQAQNAEASMPALVACAMYEKGLTKYGSIEQAALKLTTKLLSDAKTISDQVHEQLVDLTRRKEELDSVTEESLNAIKKDKWFLLGRMSIVGLMTAGLAGVLFYHVDYWNLNPEKMTTVLGGIVTWNISAIATKITSSIVLVGALYFVLKVFRTYAHNYELLVHQSRMLKSLRSLAYLGPESARDSVYLKIIDVITRFDGLEQKKHGDSEGSDVNSVATIAAQIVRAAKT